MLGALASCLALVASPATAGLGEGYVGSSTSNDVHPFNLVTLIEGGDGEDKDNAKLLGRKEQWLINVFVPFIT